MSTLTFSTENLIALNKLEASFRREFGKRHALSEERSLLDLISSANISKSVQVQAALLSFLQGLSAEQKHQLVYRGVVVNKTAIKAATAKTPTTKTQVSSSSSNGNGRLIERTYRGVTQVAAAGALVSGAEQTKTSDNKPQRIYRGRFVLN